MPEISARPLPPDKQAEIAATLQRGAREADCGAFEDAARLFREALAASRGSGARVERLALSSLSRLFVRQRREIEALSVSRRLLTLSEAAGDVEGRCLALGGIIGALGHLDDWARFDEEAARLETAIADYDGQFRLGLMRHLRRFRAKRELARGDVAAARREIEELRKHDADSEYAPSRRFGHLVHALVDVADGRPEEARAALAKADAVRDAESVHMSLRAYVSARCSVAIDGPEMGRAAVGLALYATEGAADGVAARLRYALLLAQLAEKECAAPDLAKRAYESAAAAVLLRTAEIDRAMREIPELAGEHADDAKSLADFRRRFADEQAKVLEAVAPLLRARIASGDVPLWTRDSLRDAIGVCAWCLRVRLVDGTMLPVGHFLPSDPSLRVSHGICPPCVIRISSTHHVEAPKGKR